MVKINKIQRVEDLPDNWKHNILILWVEDDVATIDKEKLPSAWVRITNTKFPQQVTNECIYVKQEEDVVHRIYQGGWYTKYYPEGSSIGVLLDTNFGPEYDKRLEEINREIACHQYCMNEDRRRIAKLRKRKEELGYNT